MTNGNWMLDPFDVWISEEQLDSMKLDCSFANLLQKNQILVSIRKLGTIDDYIEIMRKDK